MKFEWSKQLSTGVESIDNQHKELINRVNDLLNAAKEGKGKEEVQKTVKFLSDYIDTHFADEEKLMRDNNYSNYEKHKSIHDKFKMDFQKLIKEKESLSFGIKLQVQVGEWLINHINKIDKEMAKEIKSN